MAVSKAPNPTMLAIGNVTGTIKEKNAEHASVTAPTKEGYKFLCWLYVISEGWIGNMYFENPTYTSTNVWVADTGLNVDATGTFRAYCLFIPT